MDAQSKTQKDGNRQAEMTEEEAGNQTADLKCKKCGMEASYSHAEALDNSRDEDGNPVEQDCNHCFEYPETELPYDSDKYAVVRSSPVKHTRFGEIVMTGSKKRMKEEAFEKDKVSGMMYTDHKISDLEEMGFKGENQQ